MDINNYSKEIQDLNTKMLEQKGVMAPEIFDTLSVLMEKADELNDDNMIGYVHYHLADSLYAFEVDYSRFRVHLAKAINHLQIANDNALLVRAYNYVGIDALNNGSFDVAYYYYMTALDIAKSINSSYLEGIVMDNIGQVFERIGNYDKALDYVHSSNELQLEGDTSDIYFYQNMVNGYFSEGVLNIALGNIEEAKRLENEIRKLESNEYVANVTSVVIPVSFLRLQLAILEGNEDLVEEYSEKAMDMIDDAHRLFDFITDIRDLCYFLIEYNRLEIVRKILDEISEIIKDNNINEMMRHLSNIEVAYYEKLGDEEQVAKHLRDLYILSKKQEKEQTKIYEMSIELINSMNKLKKEREILLAKAETDPLTGIANRSKMEQYIDNAFERGYKNNYTFAIEMLDIDRFKEYNDTYGHQAGDKVLRRVTKAILKATKNEDLNIARYGGDEFVIVYENKSDEEILEIAKKIYKAVHDLNIEHPQASHTGRITISQGICNDIPIGKVKSWEFFAEADEALYEAKKSYYTQKNYDPIKITHLPK